MSAGRFKYGSINVDFERGWSDFQIEKINKQSVTESMSGIQETLEYYSRDLIHLKRNNLSGTEINQLRRWWDYVKNGSSFSLYRDKDFGMEIDFAGKNLITSNGNSPTFARAGVANVVDPDTGLLTSIAENTARFPAGNFNRGLLVEGEMENFITIPHDLNNAAWVKSNCTATAPGAIPATILSPTGGANECSSVVSSGGAGTSYVRYDTGETIAADEDVCFSVWLKSKLSTKTVTLKIYAKTNATQLNEKTVTVTNEWQKFSISYDNENNDTGDDWRVYYEWSYSSLQTLYHDGAQLEKNQYPTTFFNGTRGVESCYYDLDSNNWNPIQWSISFWLKHPWKYDVGTYRYLFNLMRGTTIATAVCMINSANNFYTDVYRIDGGSLAATTVSANFLAKDTWQHIVITCDTIIGNGLKIYFNGILKDTSTSNSGVPDVPTRLYVGRAQSTNNYNGNSIFDDINIYKTVLSSSEIKAIYNKNYALGFEQNYWSAVKIINPNFKPIFEIGGKWNFEVDLIEVLS